MIIVDKAHIMRGAASYEPLCRARQAGLTIEMAIEMAIETAIEIDMVLRWKWRWKCT